MVKLYSDNGVLRLENGEPIFSETSNGDLDGDGPDQHLVEWPARFPQHSLRLRQALRDAKALLEIPANATEVQLPDGTTFGC